MKRIDKIKSYCCIGLFYAVEEAEGGDEVKVKYTRSFRGKSVWYVEVPDGSIGGNLISYCPWCGTKLPKTPYLVQGSEA
ncbi:hypothetical protein ACJJIR_02015 [Microbulbifer sp. SSSA008]|uniref:hypothetical protein n=1 Tax=Microbulbifer sp. SSSA008 TaxID=3243380 RepID=UPI00403A7BF9